MYILVYYKIYIHDYTLSFENLIRASHSSSTFPLNHSIIKFNELKSFFYSRLKVKES